MRAIYKQRYDGEGFTVESGKLTRWACCDCGLVHDLVFVSHDKKDIGVAAKVNQRSTKGRRRSAKFRVKIKKLAKAVLT